jgi:peptidyl-prolyl cis-trans isomerase SurA
LNKKIKDLTGLTPNELRLRDEKAFIATRRQILERLIDDKITQAKVLELGIEVDQKQVDESIERIKRENRWTQEDLMAKLEQEGLSLEKYREEMKIELERIQLINMEVRSKIVIREETLRAYYEENKEQFIGEEKAGLASIFLIRKNSDDGEETRELRQKGNEILKRLRAGEDFGTLARIYSQGPGSEDGGNLGIFELSQLDPQLRKVIAALPEGGFSDLVFRPNGVQIIKVTTKEGGQGKSFEEMKDAIYRILYREEINKRYATWIKELRESAYTKIVF